MKHRPQAVRRSPLYFKARSFWRAGHVQEAGRMLAMGVLLAVLFAECALLLFVGA